MPFKLNHDLRHHIPKQKRKVVNWRDYDASLRQRGSLTVWFTDEAVEGWRAAPRTTQGGQPWYSPLAILTALTLRAVFRLALRQTEGLIGSVIGLLGLTLRVPDHSTLSRRATNLEVPRPSRSSLGADGEAMHLLVDSTGLKLCDAGEWLIEKHGTRARRSWRKLHIGLDADSGQIVALALTDRDVDDASQVGPLLDQLTGELAAFTADGGAGPRTGTAPARVPGTRPLRTAGTWRCRWRRERPTVRPSPTPPRHWSRAACSGPGSTRSPTACSARRCGSRHP